MKIYFIPVALMLVSSLTNAKTYECTLMEGGTPRFGIQKIKIDFFSAVDLSSRFELNILETEHNSIFSNFRDVKAVYAHSANIHSGRHFGYKKFSPSIRLPSPQVFKEKLREIAFLERSDRRSAILALIGTVNAEYYCQ